ncbi:MAG: ATP-binding protein [Anaerolineae bacterium]|nr:ATP-binding protein [Anaerolineae bacterium]
MPKSAQKFAQLLTEGVHRIRLREAKTIQIVQDELGYALGREGESAIEYWRKGHLPPYLADVEKLARIMVERGRLEREWLEQFLSSAGHPAPEALCEELFPLGRGNPRPVLTDDRPLLAEFNPFVVGPPIMHPRHFFGRDYELKRIFGLWRRFPLQNVAIIGLRRSGKTSLLHYLQKITTIPPDQLRPGQFRDWLPQPERYRWIFVDFQDARMGRRESLLRYLLAGLNLPVPEPCNLERFMDVVSQRLRQPAIILLDEISAALASPELDEQFWGSLRSLGSNLTGGNLAFLLTAHQAPAELAEAQGKSSPFFNIFGHSFILGPLKETEARELIASSPQPFTPAEVEWILGQSKNWPCLLQALCHARLTALEYGEMSDAWQQEGLQQIAAYSYLLRNEIGD